MKLRYLPLLLLLSAFASAQGYHRSSQLLARGSGVQANVAPYARILVCTSGTNCASTPTLYSDAALTMAIANPVVADGNGNYSYYVGASCVDEQYTAPGATKSTALDVCSGPIAGAYSLTVAALTYNTQVITTTSIAVPAGLIPVCTPSGYSIPLGISVACDVSSGGFLNFRITNTAQSSAGNWAGATFSVLYKFL